MTLALELMVAMAKVLIFVIKNYPILICGEPGAEMVEMVEVVEMVEMAAVLQFTMMT